MGEKVFNHVAVAINNPAEIENFYINILGLEIIKEFTLQKQLCSRIFNIEKDIRVVVAGKGDFTMELFISAETSHRTFQHTCITVDEREEVVGKAQENNYPCNIIKRDISDLVFIQDKSNNLFEIKQKINNT